MGWRLVKAFLDTYCRGHPGPEWQTLLRLCDDAPNSTAVSAIGWEELAIGQSRRTVTRHLAVLEQQGWVETVSKAAPGHRARYRVLPKHYEPPEREPFLAHDGEPDVSQREPRREPKSGRTWATMVAHAPNAPTEAPRSVVDVDESATGSRADRQRDSQAGEGFQRAGGRTHPPADFHRQEQDQDQRWLTPQQRAQAQAAESRRQRGDTSDEDGDQ
jgi:hypothetical protein